MLTYPVRFAPDGDSQILLTFPDVPEVKVVAKTEDEAIENASAALEAALAAYVLDGRPIPSPSDICGAPTITTKQFSLVGMD